MRAVVEDLLESVARRSVDDRLVELRKGVIHPNDYFDRIYCISLERRPDRWQTVEARFRKWGMNVERRVAVDGLQLASSRSAKKARITTAELGCLLSHLQTVEDARRRGFRRILILEDDVCFHRRFLDRFQEIASIPDDWMLLYLGCSQYDWRGVKSLNRFCYRAHKTLGTFAYAMDRRIYGDFLTSGNSGSRPVDSVLSQLQAGENNNCLAWYPPLIIADVRDSDIRRARSQLQHSARMRWKLDSYEHTDEGASMLSPVEPIPACRFRLPSAEGHLAQCRHPQVRAAGGIVSAEICELCQLRESPNQFGVPAPDEFGPDVALSVSTPTGVRGTESSRDGDDNVDSRRREWRGEDRIRPHVLLAIDRFGWAFHADAEGLLKYLSHEFSFTVALHRDLAQHPELVEGDLLFAYWWQSLLGIKTDRVGTVVCGLFDTWSWDIHGPPKLQSAFDKATAVLVCNPYILDDLRNHPAGFRPPSCFICEEGVDCDVFQPQSFPDEYCVGWAGTTANARSYAGQPDGKGLGLIQAAAKMSGVRLVAAHREDKSAGSVTADQIPHESMPQQYFRRISAHCVGSYSEGAPLTVGEALACGRPVISTNVGIVPALVQHGVNGLIVPRDAASLAEAMLELQKIGPETMSAAARRSSLLFDWSRQAPKWAHCFHSALKIGRRRTAGLIAPRPEFSSGEWRVDRCVQSGK